MHGQHGQEDLFDRGVQGTGHNLRSAAKGQSPSDQYGEGRDQGAGNLHGRSSSDD